MTEYTRLRSFRISLKHTMEHNQENPHFISNRERLKSPIKFFNYGLYILNL